MIIRCNWNSKQYNRKPTDDGEVQKELAHPTNLELRELAESLVMGCNVRPSECCGISDEKWKSQQLFLLDIDNKTDPKLSPEQAYQMAVDNGLKVSFMYYTHSSTDQCPRYRIAFLMAEKITDLDLRNRVMNALFHVFEEYADKKCKHPSRMFYGGHSGKVLYPNYEEVNEADDVLKLLPQDYVCSNSVPHKNRKKSYPRLRTSLSAAVTAIRNHDADYFRQTLDLPHRVAESRDELWHYFYSEVSLADFLGVTEGESINCIFSEHEDVHPSASVYQSNINDIWLYTCQSHPNNSNNYNIREIVEKLGEFRSVYRAVEFLKQALNVELELDSYQREKHEDLDFITQYLDLGQFAEKCPYADRTTRYCKDIFRTMVAIAKDNIYSEKYSYNGQAVFFATHKTILSKSGRNLNSKQQSQVTKYLGILSYLGMVRKLKDDEIPKPLLKKARQIVGGKNKRHVEFYVIPNWTMPHLEKIEYYGVSYTQNGYRSNGVSFEAFARAEGRETAERYSPQMARQKAFKDEKKTTTEAQDKRHDIIDQLVQEHLKAHGYFREADIIEEAKRYMSWYYAERQVKRSIAQIRDSYGLKRVKCSKVLKQKYGIEDAGYPYIYIVSED